MKAVFKYAVGPLDESMELPEGAEILSVGFQEHNFCFWAKVDTEAPHEERKFRVYGTGHQIPEELADRVKFVGTGHIDGLVFHMFEVV